MRVSARSVVNQDQLFVRTSPYRKMNSFEWLKVYTCFNIDSRSFYKKRRARNILKTNQHCLLRAVLRGVGLNAFEYLGFYRPTAYI